MLSSFIAFCSNGSAALWLFGLPFGGFNSFCASPPPSFQVRFGGMRVRPALTGEVGTRPHKLTPNVIAGLTRNPHKLTHKRHCGLDLHSQRKLTPKRHCGLDPQSPQTQPLNVIADLTRNPHKLTHKRHCGLDLNSPHNAP
jgi:hypothetical protein